MNPASPPQESDRHSVTPDGADGPSDERDLIERASLGFTDMGDPELRSILEPAENFYREEAPSGFALAEMVSKTQSVDALACIRKFSRHESDLSNNNPKGLGRVSTKGFPRFGSTLYKEARKASMNPLAITYAVERIVHAGYLTTILSMKQKPITQRGDQLWELWIPLAYTPPADFLDNAMGMSAYDDFIGALLRRHGFSRSVKRELKMGSPLMRSYGGLAGTGVALALLERN